MRDDRLPTGWVSTTLGECYKWSSGGTPLRSNSAYYGGEIPWAVIGDLPDGPISSTSTSITDAGLENSSAKWAEQGSLLVAMYGSIGKLGIARERITTNQAIAFTNPHPVLVSYLFWYLYYQRGQLHARGKGGTQRNISQTVIRSFPFVLAPLPEQHRIVAKLDELFSELDAGVAALERAQAKLKRYRASVLKAAVEGRLTEEWRRKNPPDETGAELLQRILVERRQLWEQEQLAKFKAKGQRPPKNWQQKYEEPVETNISELPELPEGWCWATVDQVSTTVKYGSSAKTSLDLEGVPVLRMGNIQEGTLNLERLKHLPLDHSEFPKLLLANGDLLFNRTNSAELVGKTAVYRGRPDPCSFASYLISVRMIRSCLSGVVANALNSSWGRAWIASVVSQQVGQANVNGTKLRAFTFPLPPETEQGEIISRSVDAVHSVTDSSHVIADLLQQAIALRQSILKRAFEGELVPQNPRDEPASLLLGRIRVTREVQRPKKKSRHSKTPVQRIQDP